MLSFGMVLPDYQRQGIGTTLLLARLSLIPQTRDSWIVCMTSVGGSDSFYRRYGFRFVANVPGARNDHFPLFKTLVLRRDPGKIKAMLAARNVKIDSAEDQLPIVLAETEKTSP